MRDVLKTLLHDHSKRRSFVPIYYMVCLLNVNFLKITYGTYCCLTSYSETCLTLSKPKILGTSFFVWNGQVFGLYRLNLHPNKKQWNFKLEAQHWAEPVSLTFHSALRKLNTEPSIGASHQISVHFGKAVSEKKIFRNRPI